MLCVVAKMFVTTCINKDWWKSMVISNVKVTMRDSC
jgi:hypothetical protein